MQDTIADKLLPRWLSALAENPGSQIEVLYRAEKLGVLDEVEQWLGARKLRNLLVHECMESAEGFAENLLEAKNYCVMLAACYNQMRVFAQSRMGLSVDELPKALDVMV